MTEMLAGTTALAGTAALVTGASSGIGAATATALAAHGAAVALLARRAERLQQVKADIESAGGTALAVTADVTNAEEIAAAFPEAEVVKAFNTLFAQVIGEGSQFADTQKAPTFVASDSERAKQTATSLAESIGFDAIDAGPLKNARYLEPLAGLNIYFGYGAGQGTGIAPTWIRRH